MQIQTLSIVVPTHKCINNCKCCVLKMHSNEYTNQIEGNVRFRDLYEKDYLKRLQFARDNGCNTTILTGRGEPLQNKDFLPNFAHWNNMLRSPFQWIELQTTGIFLDEEKVRFLRNTVGVNTISLSVFDIYNDGPNADVIGMPVASRFKLTDLCKLIKTYDFNLRLSINLINVYDEIAPQELFNRVKILGADQVIFRKMYLKGDNCEQDKWIESHGCINTK